jgi:hypothetical protein
MMRGGRLWPNSPPSRWVKIFEFLVAGKVLMKSRLTTPLLGGALNIIGIFGANEIVDVANRLAKEGRMEINAIVPLRR